MSDAEAKAEEDQIAAEDKALELRDQAMMRFPQREGESDERYEVRIDKCVVVLPHLWPKGQSGNPAGARKKFTNFKTSIEDALTEGVNITWKVGEITNLKRVTRQELFMQNVIDLLVYGEIELPTYKNVHRARKEGIEAEGRTIHLAGKDWADFALKFMRYVAPPLAPEKATEVTQVVFDLGTFMPKEVKKTIIRQKIGTDAIKYELEDPDVIDGEVVEEEIEDDGQDQ